MTNYNGDLDKASDAVQAIVIGYDRATLECNPLAQRNAVQIAEQFPAATPVDQTWLDTICQRHMATRLDSAHNTCVQTYMNLMGLLQVTADQGLTTLHKVIHGTMNEIAAVHSECIKKAQAPQGQDDSTTESPANGPGDRAAEYALWTGETLLKVLGVVVTAAAAGIGLAITISQPDTKR